MSGDIPATARSSLTSANRVLAGRYGWSLEAYAASSAPFGRSAAPWHRDELRHAFPPPREGVFGALRNEIVDPQSKQALDPNREGAGLIGRGTVDRERGRGALFLEGGSGDP